MSRAGNESMTWLKIDGCWHAFDRTGVSKCGMLQVSFVVHGGRQHPADRFCCWRCHTTVKREVMEKKCRADG